jgi:hypothetical protein
MRLSPSDEKDLRDRAHAVGMTTCAECVTKYGHLEDGGIWVDTDTGLIGRKKWIKHRWTVEVGGERYALGQDMDQGVIAYGTLASGGRALPVWRAISMAIRYALLAIVLAVWTAAGFIFWIPLLVRATIGFCITAIYANLVSANAEVPNERLQHAALFYANGFRSILRGVIEPHAAEPQAIPPVRGGRFFVEALWAVLTWWAGLLILSYLGIAFSSSLDQLVYPVVWLTEQVSAGLEWVNQQLDVLINRGREVIPPTP